MTGSFESMVVCYGATHGYFPSAAAAPPVRCLSCLHQRSACRERCEVRYPDPCRRSQTCRSASVDLKSGHGFTPCSEFHPVGRRVSSAWRSRKPKMQRCRRTGRLQGWWIQQMSMRCRDFVQRFLAVAAIGVAPMMIAGCTTLPKPASAPILVLVVSEDRIEATAPICAGDWLTSAGVLFGTDGSGPVIGRDRF